MDSPAHGTNSEGARRAPSPDQGLPGGPSSGGANQMLFYAFRCDEPWASAPPATLPGQRGNFAYQTAMEAAQPRNWAGAAAILP